MLEINKELESLEFDLGFTKREPCSNKEIKEFRKKLKAGEALPDDVIRGNDNFGNYEFHRIIKSDVSPQQEDKLIKYRKLSYLKTIKNILVYFAILVSIVVFFVMLSIIQQF